MRSADAVAILRIGADAAGASINYQIRRGVAGRLVDDVVLHLDEQVQVTAAIQNSAARPGVGRIGEGPAVIERVVINLNGSPARRARIGIAGHGETAPGAAIFGIIRTFSGIINDIVIDLNGSL